MRGSLLRDLRLLALLFVCARVVLFLVAEPTILDGQELGIGRIGDQRYYYELAQFSERGWLPFRDWWSEFPPLWPWLTVIVVQVGGAELDYARYALVMVAIMTAADLGNLWLLHSLAQRLYGAERATELTWLYALLPIPLIFTYWTFDAIVVFWLLLSLWLYIQGDALRAAGSILLGTLTKYLPMLWFVVFWRDRRPGAPAWRRIGWFVLLSLAFVYGALFAFGSEMTVASLRAQWDKPAYQSIWALLEGRYTTGLFGPMPAHLAASASQSATIPLIPAWLRWGAWALIALGTLARREIRQDRAIIAACGYILLTFYLAAQGWSPQWLLPLLPLILLVFPTRAGILTLVALSLLALADYPALFARSGPIISGSARLLFIAIVTLREGMLLALCLAFYRQLRSWPIVHSSQPVAAIT